MIEKKTLGGTVFDTFNAILLTGLSLITIYPFWYIIVASFSDVDRLEYYVGLLFSPLGFSLDSYRAVLGNPRIYTGYKNTLMYVVFGTAINIFMTSLGAYVLSRRNYYWKKLVMKMVVFSMYFSGGLVPMYLLMRELNLYNNIWAIILPGAIGTWNLIIMRTSFMAIPYELEESAKIDGANDLVVLFRIILPLSLPVIAVMVLYYGVGHWNAWFNAMIYLRDAELHPLQLILKEILLQNDITNMRGDSVGADEVKTAEALKYATIMVSTVPILMAYPFLQKYFVKGVMVGALKG